MAAQTFLPGDYTPSTRTEPFAIWGLVAAFVISPVGLVLSIIALQRISRSGAAGKGLAVAGVVLSALNLLLGVVLILSAVAIPVFLNQRNLAEQTQLETILGEAAAGGTAHHIDFQSWPTSVEDLGVAAPADGYTLQLMESGADGFCLLATGPTDVVMFMDEQGATSLNGCP